MKKRRMILSVLLFIIAAAIGLLFWTQQKQGGDVSNIKRTVATSETYREQDINDAMDTVIKHFKSNFKGCTLTDLWYEESTSVTAAAGWAQQYEADTAIVLLSNFNVDASGGDGSFNPNDTYPNWQWILVRSNGGKWELKTSGY